MATQLLIFDWDGTLVDSVDHIAESLHRAAACLGFPERSRADLRDIIGLGMVEALERLYPGITRDEMRALRDTYADHFFAQETTAESIFAGAVELLARARERGLRLAVATGKSRRGLELALDSTGLRGMFDLTRCADETRSKPDPLMLQEILAHFAVSAEQAIMIGDTTYDMDMARRATMPAVGVEWGVHTAQQLAAFEPKGVASDLGHLARLLDLD